MCVYRMLSLEIYLAVLAIPLGTVPLQNYFWHGIPGQYILESRRRRMKS